MEGFLIENNYCGEIDINLIATIDKNTGEPIYTGLEYTPRLGKPSVFIEDELHITPWANLAYDCAKGD